MPPAMGEAAPDFTLPSTDGVELSLAKLLEGGEHLIVAFYPKDNTSG